MPYFYPVLLNLEGRRCAVIGGNAMAAEKALGLCEAGAVVTVLAETVVDELAEAILLGNIRWIQRQWQRGDLAGFYLAVCAPDDRRINAAIHSEAEEHGILFNALDDPPHCGFIYPSIHRQGDLVVAISTSGSAPALAVRIRQRLGSELGPEYGEFLRLARGYRDAITGQIAEFGPRRELWYRIVDSEIVSLLKHGDQDGARALFENLLAEAGVVVASGGQKASVGRRGDGDERAV
jgi:siroheme synthase-like protein